MEVERFIRERLPLNAPHFSIFLNQKLLEPVFVAGKRFPINLTTPYGPIQGEVILPNIRTAKNSAPGLECLVRGVVITRSHFEMEQVLTYNLRGRLEANFIPITSDRSRFITDSPEYAVFVREIQKELKKITKKAREINHQKAQQKADTTLKDTLSSMGRAIRKNPDLAPQIMSPTGEIDETAAQKNSPKFAPAEDDATAEGVEATQLNLTEEKKSGAANSSNSIQTNQKEKPLPKKIRVKNLPGKEMVARKIKIGGVGVTCTLENCGRNSPPVFSEGGIIYLNQDHPLYAKQAAKGKENLKFYLAYLISQQVALMLTEHNPRRAFEVQNRLLTDSL